MFNKNNKNNKNVTKQLHLPSYIFPITAVDASKTTIPQLRPQVLNPSATMHNSGYYAWLRRYREVIPTIHSLKVHT